MSKAMVNKVNFYYEISGEGFPLVFCHEFAGDFRSWESQVRFFRKRYKVITYNARGYPPSDVPNDIGMYSQEQAVEDLFGLLNYLNINRAHIVGLSMGGNVALNFGIKYPNMTESLIIAGTGTGSTKPRLFKKNLERFAQSMDSEGMQGMSDYVNGPTRVQLLRKDPDSWREFHTQFFQHSSLGSAMTFRGVQGKRLPIFSLESELRSLSAPTLIMFGDEDEPCIEPGIFMKKYIPSSGLVVFPQSGHAINLEEPDLFNRTIQEFLAAVQTGQWAVNTKGCETGSLI